ncbi:hypothetical protein ACFL13_02605 [Patescibacteria group bacterium]
MKTYQAVIIIFLVTLLGYLSNSWSDYKRDLKNTRTRRILVSDDLVPNTFLPYAIIRHKTLKLTPVMDDIRPLFQGGKQVPYFTIYNDTHNEYYSSYPVLTGLVALPLYVVPVLLKIPNLDTHLNLLKVMALGRVAGSIFASLSVVLFYILLRKFSGIKKQDTYIYIFTFFYAFGTTTWSVSSRGLWQHTISQLFITLLIFNLWASIKKPYLIKYSGLILGLAVLARPTNIIFALLITSFVFLNYRKHLNMFLLWAIPPAIFLFLYNYLSFGSPFVEGYQSRHDVNWNSPLREGITGWLFSPARSFLFISPPLVFGLVKIVRTLFSKEIPLKKYLAFGFIIFTLIMAKWWAWDGSDSFGYRMLTDVLPIIALFSYLATKDLSKNWKIIIVTLMVYSFFVHFNASIYRKSRCEHEHNWTFYCLKLPTRRAQY